MSAGQARLLRLATFNLLHGAALGSRQVDEADLREAVRLLDVDILGLQEADRLQPRSGLIDQAEIAAETLGTPYWRFVPALNGPPHDPASWTCSSDDDGATTSGPTVGVALISRWRVTEWHVRRLPVAPVSMPVMIPGQGMPWLPEQPRVALAALVESPAGPLTVVTLHLSIVPGWNVAQLRAVGQWAKRFPAPRLLMGDFNLPGSVVRRTARGWEQLARTATFPSDRPRVQLDHVLGDGIGLRAVQEVRAVRLPVSDHRALALTLRV